MITRKLSIYTFLLTFLISVTNVGLGEEVTCIKSAENGGADGYDETDYTPPQSSQHNPTHLLYCVDPGENACEWPDDTPCGGIINDPIPTDIEITDDEGNNLYVDIEAINDQIEEMINNGDYEGHIIVTEGMIEVTYEYYTNEDGTQKIKTVILTDSSTIL